MSSTISDYEDIEYALRLRSHQPAGPVYKSLRKMYAKKCFKNNEQLKGIYNLTESHAVSFRIKTAYRYDRINSSVDPNSQITMNKEYISFDCTKPIESEMEKMLTKIEDLPKEWTIVQITTQFNKNESRQIDLSNANTDALYISVFNCGQNTVKPFCINVNAPIADNSEPIELVKEMKSIIESNKNQLASCFASVINKEQISLKQRVDYVTFRENMNSRLKEIVQQVGSQWLKHWRCLLTGKIVDPAEEKSLFDKINSILDNDNTGYEITETNRYIMLCILSCSQYLSKKELLQALSYCIPPNHKELRTKIYNVFVEVSMSYAVKNIKRHPVILIVDEKIDCFPWEMLDVLLMHPVSRMPSLHFTYALYKEHETSIMNGFVMVNPVKGRYVINPSDDLKTMENRLRAFFNYWLPEWTGTIGQKPEPEEFSQYLAESDIFTYNGHGNGTQYLNANEIQQFRVNGVVLLFGCSSGRLNSMGSLTEMYDVFHNYLIACSPCVVGMLWEVTDFDTDRLSTTVLSYWISSKDKTHWKFVDKKKWGTGDLVFSDANHKTKSFEQNNEPELLRAIRIAQQENVQYVTKSAMIARGLPIKLVI